MEISQKHIKNNCTPGKQTARPSKNGCLEDTFGEGAPTVEIKSQVDQLPPPKCSQGHHNSLARFKSQTSWSFKSLKRKHDVSQGKKTLRWKTKFGLVHDGILTSTYSNFYTIGRHYAQYTANNQGLFFWSLLTCLLYVLDHTDFEPTKAPLMLLEDIEHWIAFAMFCLANTGEHVQKTLQPKWWPNLLVIKHMQNHDPPTHPARK